MTLFLGNFGNHLLDSFDIVLGYPGMVVMFRVLKVFFPRFNHWSKEKVTVKKGFDNERLGRRPSSVDLRRFEFPWGKSINGRQILGRWSRHMRFKKSSSKLGGEHPSSGVAMKARGKGFGMVTCQNVVRA
jgi:hypothetical protein